MAYMSKTKRRRVRRQQAIRAVIVIAVIAAVFLLVWQISLGSTIAKVNGVPVRDGMVKGVEAFINYYQTGQFPSTDTEGLTEEEIKTAEDMAIVSRNSLIQSVFITTEVITQHFKAEGTVFPSAEKAAEIKETVDSIFSNTELSRLLRNNGVNRSHIEFYYTYIAALEVFKDELLEKDPITDEEIQEQYDLYAAYFVTPMKLRASHILIMDPDHTDAKRAEIEDILDKLNAGEDFATLAMEYSEDGSAEQGGDLDEFGLGQMVQPFEDACLALEIGEISGIVETEFGFHIIMLTDKIEESVQTVEDVRDQLVDIVSSERTTEAIDALKEEADIVYNGLTTPSTGKPPTSLTELAEARGEAPEDEAAEDEYDFEIDYGDDYDPYDDDHDPYDGGDHEGHDH